MNTILADGAIFAVARATYPSRAKSLTTTIYTNANEIGGLAYDPQHTGAATVAG